MPLVLVQIGEEVWRDKGHPGSNGGQGGGPWTPETGSIGWEQASGV